jgi:uncharacterized protein (TIGR00255 family)
MALMSMTGFGRGEASAGGVSVAVELSSVNRKQFETRVSLPKALLTLESRVQAAVHDVVTRGSVAANVRVAVSGAACRGCVRVDRDMALAYLQSLRAVAGELGLADDITAEALIQLPDVVRHEDAALGTEDAWRLVKRALDAALRQLAAMRRAEGHKLELDLRARMDTLRALLDRIRRRAPGVVRRYRDVLRRRMKSLGVECMAGDASLARELALFADRADITEEIVRMDSHFAQVAKLAGTSASVGRTLDFLCQEMFREINTIGSKANDAAISRCVVRFKTELEIVREQVQNIE